ncbi:MAG: electron transfer flavoprotein subunit alpha/FixB family protein [Chloroflexi bacterium]|nr:electron transfer flavoprotein subunit alpha/FixB family protein [Chloroflexota bacterium]
MITPSYTPAEARGIWIFLEQEGGRLEGVSLELLGRGRQLADEAGTELVGVLLGGDVEAAAQAARAAGADRVLVAEHPALGIYTTDAYTKIVGELVLERRPDILLMGATPNGRDLAGRLAVRLRTGLTADCTGLELESGTGLLLGRVTGFGGGVVALIKCVQHRPQMATVRPGIFTPPAPLASPTGVVERVPAILAPSDLQTEVVERAIHEGLDLTKAERIVVGGRGTHGDFGLLNELAGLIGAEVGATRVAVDQGWVERERQVGQTGYVTHPKLAVVCGISGAMHFTVGIDAAECVIAINTDEEATIFDHADYCIVDDLFNVLPPLINRIRVMSNE